MAGWTRNRRGAGWLFGLPALQDFLRKHDLDMVVRAHETIHTGWEGFGNNELVTVFSAPDYQGYRNTGRFTFSLVMSRWHKLSMQDMPGHVMELDCLPCM